MAPSTLQTSVNFLLNPTVANQSSTAYNKTQHSPTMEPPRSAASHLLTPSPEVKTVSDQSIDLTVSNGASIEASSMVTDTVRDPLVFAPSASASAPLFHAESNPTTPAQIQSPRTLPRPVSSSPAANRQAFKGPYKPIPNDVRRVPSEVPGYPDRTFVQLNYTRSAAQNYGGYLNWLSEDDRAYLARDNVDGLHVLTIAMRAQAAHDAGQATNVASDHSAEEPMRRSIRARRARGSRTRNVITPQPNATGLATGLATAETPTGQLSPDQTRATPARRTRKRKNSDAESSDAPKRLRAKSSPKAQPENYNLIRDYVSALPPMKEDEVKKVKAEFCPDGQRIDISQDPDMSKLHPWEREFCAANQLTAERFLSNKRLVIVGYIWSLINNYPYTKTKAQNAGCIDVNKTSRAWVLFNAAGWFNPKHFAEAKKTEMELGPQPVDEYARVDKITKWDTVAQKKTNWREKMMASN